MRVHKTYKDRILYNLNELLHHDFSIGVCGSGYMVDDVEYLGMLEILKETIKFIEENQFKEK